MLNLKSNRDLFIQLQNHFACQLDETIVRQCPKTDITSNNASFRLCYNSVDF